MNARHATIAVGVINAIFVATVIVWDQDAFTCTQFPCHQTPINTFAGIWYKEEFLTAGLVATFAATIISALIQILGILLSRFKLLKQAWRFYAIFILVDSMVLFLAWLYCSTWTYG